jgi:RNA-binding protein YlmH
MRLLSFAVVVPVSVLLFVTPSLAFTLSSVITTTTTTTAKMRRATTSLLVLHGGGINMGDIERKAQLAAEAWDTHVTAFCSPTDAIVLEQRLSNRADVSCIRLPSSADTASRVRFVFSNPESGLDVATAEEEHCTTLHVTNADYSGSDPWPNLLNRIGVDLDNVGDIVVHPQLGCYIVVSPTIAKQCIRLLPKEIVGTGVTVTALDAGETIPDGGELQDMVVQRLDKRQQKGKSA